MLHLGHPERGINSMITPHLTSAFAMFGFFAAFYLVLLAIEVWFVFRADNVARANNSTGFTRFFYRAVTLWSDDVSPRALRWDSKWLFTLAIIGIPAAHGLHGYVGFVYGSLKAREWWGSDMMPVIFLFSAIVSGVALLVVLYVFSCKVRKVRIDHDCLKGMTYALWGFLMFVVILEGLEFANLIYKGKEGIDVILEYVRGPLLYRFFLVQLFLCSLVPIITMTFLIARNIRGRAFVIAITTCACLVLIGVFMMRWNVVIGGQEISKSLRGLLSYTPELTGHESVVGAVSVMLAPLGLLWILVRLFPPWLDKPEDAIKQP
jgi:predicted membrane protein